MKRTCYDCRALSQRGQFDIRCALNKHPKLVRRHIEKGLWVDIPTPTEECPKPKTYKAYFAALEVYADQRAQ